MQKIKTHKASAKRFSLTKNGKVKMNHPQHRHKLGIKTDDKFWEDALAADYETMHEGFCLTKGIEKIFNDKNFKQCIATGGIRSKTAEKINTAVCKKKDGISPPFFIILINLASRPFFHWAG